MEKQIILAVLTKSSKYSKYCVAGIDWKTGAWYRLITDDESSHGAVGAQDLIDANGRECDILDVVQVPVITRGNNILQPENVLIDQSKDLTILGKTTLEEILKIHPAEINDYVLGNKYAYIKETKVDQIGHSLTLIKVNDIQIRQVSNPEGNPKTKADFTYMFEQYENLSVTDYRFYSMPHGTHFDNAYLVVSIGSAYNGRYYKFVSAIYV